MESTTIRKDAPVAKATNKPVKSFRLHGISVSVFANPVKIEGRDKTFYKVAMAKSYRDDVGEAVAAYLRQHLNHVIETKSFQRYRLH